MPRPITISAEYFGEYRKKLGFSNQAAVKRFFGAKDIIPRVDLRYVKMLNERLYEIIDRMNSVVASEVRIKNMAHFKKTIIDRPFEIMRASGILSKLNNQGRRPEQVYFSWMRGYVVSNFFLKALGLIFGVDAGKIHFIGDDDFETVDTFKRTPKADWEIEMNDKETIRIETQAGFADTNDIKQHKVLEAKRVFRERKIHSIAIHFDLYNGQVAFLQLDEIKENDVHWITRQQMEGQTVLNIGQNYFVWKLTESPVKYKDIDFG